MGYRKFGATQLFTGREIQSGQVLITNEDGIVEAITDFANAGDNIETLEGLIIPGFVNTHCHIELSHMKGLIPPGTGLVPFLTRVITKRNFPAEVIRHAMEDAEKELYDSGTSAIGDICNTTDSIFIKNNSKIQWRNFIEVIGLPATGASERFANAVHIFKQFDVASSSLSPHAPYSVSRKLFELINDASQQQIISIHNQESEAENALFCDKQGEMLYLYNNLNIDASSFKASGKTSLQTYLPWLNKASGLILVHNTYASKEDVLFAQSLVSSLSELFFCICINANHYIESATPPLHMLRQCNANITLGTDSYAGNRQLNMLEEIKSIQHAFGLSVPLAEILQWATLNGAKALQMQNRFGSFEPGKQPGIVWIDQVEDQRISRYAVAKRML